MNYDPELEIKRMSRRSFTWGAFAVAGGAGLIGWINNQPVSPKSGASAGIPGPLRKVLNFNGNVAGTLASNSNLAESYPRSASTTPRVNSFIGVPDNVDLNTYRLTVSGVGSESALRLGDVMTMPRTEIVTKFKCVEGWSMIVQAAGVKFSDFLQQIKVDITKLPPYAYLATPGGDYYVGIDTKALLHPQTLLCWEMDGKPLSREHGAPLRLFIPTKYGIKNIKCVSLIRFQDERPTDYWYERGYDWYAGL